VGIGKGGIPATINSDLNVVITRTVTTATALDKWVIVEVSIAANSDIVGIRRRSGEIDVRVQRKPLSGSRRIVADSHLSPSRVK
jgi:hypothetical protein